MNCVVIDDDRITRELLCAYVNKTDGMTLYRVCQDAKEGIEVLLHEPVDLVFLDVEMPEMNGFEVLRNVPHKPAVIIITGSQGYAMDAFEVDAVDFLLKPVPYTRFLKAVQKVKALREKDGPKLKNGHVYMKVNSEIVSISREEILFVKSVGDYLQVVTPLKKYVTLGTLKNIEEKLSRKEFMKIHRSFLVRLDKIEKIRENGVQIAGNDIPLARSFKKELFSRLDMV